jgi:rod shape-determining protein MreD
MKWFLPGLLGGVAAQTVLLPAAGLWGIRPDLLLLLVFFLSPRVSPEAATLQGFAIGLTQDALSGAPLGLRAFTYSLLGFLIARLSRNLYTEEPLAQFWLLLGGCAATGALTFALLAFFLGPPPLLPTLAWVILPEAVSTAALGLLLLWLPRLCVALL